MFRTVRFGPFVASVGGPAWRLGWSRFSTRHAVAAFDEKARKAAEATASSDMRFLPIERRVASRFVAVGTRFARVDGGLLRWMVGGLRALVMPAGCLLRRVAAKIAARG